MLRSVIIGLGAILLLGAADAPPASNAALFGARESIADLSLSPDGTRVAFVAPLGTLGSAAFIRGLGADEKARVIASADGKPNRLGACHWVSNARLVCLIYGVTDSDIGLLRYTRLIAVDADGGNMKMLSTHQNSYTRGVQLNGGEVIDWLPDENGSVLMARQKLPDDHTGSNIGSTLEGLGVDKVDTSSLSARVVEQAKRDAEEFITDGRGTVRIMGDTRYAGATEQQTGIITYYYRKADSRGWEKLGDFDTRTDVGFNPYAVDHDKNVAYGFDKKDGRLALYSVALDGSLKKELIYSRADVDVDGLIRIGRRNRVVGVSFATDQSKAVYFDPEVRDLAAALSKALPKQPNVRVVDSSVDERKLLIFAGSDSDPGCYYVFDRDKHQLQTFLVARAELEGHALATMKAVSYPAADGTMIPAYLTLPPGKETAQGLPAIVMPHGGPASRDEWGFDWLPQFYAAQGYAVLQPEFRGSSGFGDAWFQKNGFQSWRTAIGDVLDAGRWLVAQHIADPAKLGIVGWSYGGYAALQAAVLDPSLFKAVVAVAPVTDLATLKSESSGWDNHTLVSDFIGSGPQIREGSPAQNAERIKVPVLLFHGTRDRNVGYAESQLMVSKMQAAGGKVELITFDGLDHYLEDSSARTQLLAKSDAFLNASFAGRAH